VETRTEEQLKAAQARSLRARSFRAHIEQRSRLRARIEEQLKTAWTRSSSLRPHTLAA
jgi:hypothetical protein